MNRRALNKDPQYTQLLLDKSHKLTTNRHKSFIIGRFLNTPLVILGYKYVNVEFIVHKGVPASPLPFKEPPLDPACPSFINLCSPSPLFSSTPF